MKGDLFMGCWNETCALSNLPIVVGERIKFLILLMTGTAGRSYYYNDTYIPLCLPMSGTYDDYGSAKDIKVDDITLEYLKNQKFYIIDKNERDIKEEKIEGVTNVIRNFGCSSMTFVALNSLLNFEKYEFTDIKTFVDDVSRDELFFEYGGKYYQLQIIMYHENLYDTLVSNFEVRVPYEQKKNLRSLWIEKLNKYYKGIKEYIELKKLPEESLTKKQLSDLIHYEFAEPVFRTARYGYNFFKWYDNFITDDEALNSFISHMVDYIIFTYTLSYGRNGFYCVSGLGSQGDERKVQTIIAEWILEYCRNLENEREHYDDEDDNCDPDEETVYWWDED